MTFKFNADQMEFKSETKGDSTKYYFEGHLLNLKRDGNKDICTKSCINDVIEQINAGARGETPSIKGSYEHDIYLKKETADAKPLSRLIHAKEDDVGVFVKGLFNPRHSLFKDAWADAQEGFMDGLSVEFKPIEKKDYVDGGRSLNKIKLWGYAHTGRPVQGVGLTNVFAKSIEFLNAKKNMEVKNMSEETKKEETSVAEKPEEKVEETKPEIKEETKPEEKVEEKKEETSAEMKSRIAQLEKENTELKSVNALIDKPEFKSLMEGAFKKIQPENKALAKQGQQKFEHQKTPGFEIKSWANRYYGNSMELK